MKRFFAAFGAVLGVATALGVSCGELSAQTPKDEGRRPAPAARPEAKSPPAKSSPARGPTQTSTIQEWRPTVVPYAVVPYAVYPYSVYPYTLGYPYTVSTGSFPNGPPFVVLSPTPSYAYPYSYPPAYQPSPIYGGAGLGDQPALPANQPAREERPANLRGTNRESLALAGKFIGYGDNHFAAQRYNDANQRYKKAAEVSPGLAEAYFRQGFALTAMGRYELAVKAIKRGLDLDPAWPRSGFRCEKLYRDQAMAKRAHLDSLAKAASGESLDPDLLFLLGVVLFFDGQRDRAAPFFQRSNQLAPGPHLTGFLAEVAGEK